MKDFILATRVNGYANNAVRALAKGLGISISEYLRKLILQDLESQKLFQDKLKEAVEQSESVARRRLTPEASIIRHLREAYQDEESE